MSQFYSSGVQSSTALPAFWSTRCRAYLAEASRVIEYDVMAPGELTAMLGTRSRSLIFFLGPLHLISHPPPPSCLPGTTLLLLVLHSIQSCL
ncbi:hypothetical protein VTN96DRAFT_10202 [Rasamsonia emersonii]